MFIFKLQIFPKVDKTTSTKPLLQNHCSTNLKSSLFFPTWRSPWGSMGRVLWWRTGRRTRWHTCFPWCSWFYRGFFGLATGGSWCSTFKNTQFFHCNFELTFSAQSTFLSILSSSFSFSEDKTKTKLLSN